MNTTTSVSEDALREIIRIVEAVPNRDQWLLWTRRQHQLFRTRSALSGILLVAETALAKASEPYAGQTDVERVWAALKEQCCSSPSQAKRCVMVSRDDLAAALLVSNRSGVDLHDLCAKTEADAVAGLRYIEKRYGRLEGVGWDRVFAAHDELFKLAAALSPTTLEEEG